jgi:hypothetical protein
MFYLNFAFGKLLPSTSISRQLESEQNVKFYLNLAQYIMYPSAAVQNERRNFHFAKCRISHSGKILDRFSKLQNVIRNFNCALCRIHRPLSGIHKRVRLAPRQREYIFSYLESRYRSPTKQQEQSIYFQAK